MAHSTLAALTHPQFPQLCDALINRTIARVDRILFDARPICTYVFPESSWGACDGFQCNQKSVVSDVDSGEPRCAGHFPALAKAVGRG